ncbi:MAG: hypothetical protein ABI717_00005 [Actinomycetota bacterium]
MRRSSLLLLPLLALAAGCGGGNDQTAPPGTTAATSPDVLTVTQPENTAKPGEDPTGDPQFTVTLTGESTTPTAGRPWRYTVRAKANQGGAATGTAKMRIFVDGQLVDTLGFFSFDGVLVKTHVWPRSLRGESAELQAEVEGDGGTQRAVLPVEVR